MLNKYIFIFFIIMIVGCSDSGNKNTKNKGYLIELALICRTPEHVVEYLSDVGNNRMPNNSDCSINPMRERVLVTIGQRKQMGGNSLSQWTLPTSGMTGWTLTSNIAHI